LTVERSDHGRSRYQRAQHQRDDSHDLSVSDC
jgi:hypothetical protein